MRKTPVKLARDARGIAGLELALTAPILLFMFICLADFALAFWYKGMLASSVAGGANYAVLKGPTVTASAIQGIVGQQLSLPASSVTVKGPYCSCVSGTPAAAADQTCSSLCPADAANPGTYVTITAQYTYRPILPTYSQFASPLLIETTMARLK